MEIKRNVYVVVRTGRFKTMGASPKTNTINLAVAFIGSRFFLYQFLRREERI